MLCAGELKISNLGLAWISQFLLWLLESPSLVLLWFGLILFPSLCSFCFMSFASPGSFLHEIRASLKN